MPKISKRAVDAAKPREARYYEWDTEIRGFGLQVLPSGIRSFIFQYRDSEGLRTASASDRSHFGPRRCDTSVTGGKPDDQGYAESVITYCYLWVFWWSRGGSNP